MTRFFVPLAAAALLISFFALGSFTLFDVDEAVFSQATKEMVESGDWITPTYNGETRYDKPILLYWLMGGSYKVFGVNEFAARFPSAVSGFLLCLAVFFFVRHFRDERKAFYAAFPLALSPYFLVYTHAAVTDMVLTLFITLALFSFFLSLERRPGADRYILGTYVFSSLAFLTKGLIGILFPFGIACAYLLSTDGLRGLKKMFSLKGIILFVLLCGPWYGAQLFINGQEFIQQFFVKHHLKRYTGVISGHKGPLYYYIPALIAGLIPWVVFLPAGIRHALRDVRSGRNEHKAGSDHLDLFAFIWFAAIVTFFSLSTTKLPNYVLPGIPAAALLISFGMTEEEAWRKYSYLGIAALTAAAGIAFLSTPKYLLRVGISDTSWTFVASLVFFAVAAVSILALITQKHLYGLISALMGILLLLLCAKALPVASRSLQGALHEYSLYAKNRLAKDERIISYRINNPSIVFYSDHRTIRVGEREELIPLLVPGRRALVVAKAKEIESLRELGFNVLKEDRQFALLEKQE